MNKCKKNRLNTLQSNVEDEYHCLTSELCHARNISDLKTRIITILTNLDFSDFIFIRLHRPWEKPSQFGLLFSPPVEFMQTYHEEHMHTYDLMLSYAASNTQPIFASQVYNYFDNAPFEIELIQKNRMLTQLHKRLGFYDQYFIPIKASNGSGNVLLTILDKETSSEDFQTKIAPVITVLRSLCKAIDSVTTTKFHSSFIEKPCDAINLSPKQLAIFNILANNDLSILQTAKLMCISPITAHQHIAGVRRALGVATNIAAIKKLVKLGILDFH